MRILIIILLLTSTILPQTKNADEIINKVKNKFESVNDYKVDLKIAVDMEFLRIPKVSATVYFKQPDKMKMDSRDFAVLPKEGINFSPINLLNKNYTSIFVKEDTLKGNNVNVIKIIPLSDSTDVILSTLWIDSQNNVIRKVETTTKNRGTLVASLNYDKMIKFGLPSEMIFSFNVENPKLPEMMEMETGGVKKPLGKTSKNLAGKIKVTYSNYEVNKGIDDSFFEDDKEKLNSKNQKK
jgi:outer membrane lipoprotein-sorting protein